MITSTVGCCPPRAPAAGTPRWRKEFSRAITNPRELLGLLQIDPAAMPELVDASPEFRLRVPLPFVRRMVRGDARDPLLRQVLPLAQERRPADGFADDPTGDLDAMPLPGVLHKYQGRALLMVTGACAVHCRYCFRRHFPYGAARPRLERALGYLRADTSIGEVILSGGDPLSLDDVYLGRLAGELAGIPHLRRLRIHTRLPVVLPSRVDAGLLDWLGTGRLATVVVVHANHPNELDPALAQALHRLRDAGVALLNQTVLLKGVNDAPETLGRLSERLLEAGVLPYYLHMLDPVLGAHHFQVSERRARAIHEAMRNGLPGYLVPRLSREDPGAPAKTLLV